MFGNKREKQARLRRMADLIETSGEIAKADIAREMNMFRSTVDRDLVSLEERGILLAEDDTGRVSLFRRLRRL